MPHFLVRLFLWLAALLVLGGLLTGAYFVHHEMSGERLSESEAERAAQPRRVEGRIIKFSEALANHHEIRVEPAKAAKWIETTTVYGRVVPNPRATFEVRSPFAGTLRAGDGPWPAPGQSVKAGQLLARLDVRVGPQDRLDLLTKLNEARQKVKGAEEVVRIHKGQVERLEKSNSVPAREVEEARVQLTEAQTNLTTARAAAELWQQALDEIDARVSEKSTTWTRSLNAPANGEVAELAGQPGTAVEAGGLVLKLVDFRRVLLRLDLPPEVQAEGAPKEVDVRSAASAPAAPRARLIGAAPQVDAVSQWAGYLYESESPPPGGALWRPGLFVRAAVRPAHAAEREAIAVPAGALLYHQGRALVYVRIAREKYTRREVEVLGRDGERWLLAPRPAFAAGVGLDPDDLVVTSQAQVLLSEEFRIDVDND
jgi:biotin carboxyl carrier protein